ncbi:arginine biosynthesis bifunctional protein ArgJ [Clostridia bacterium]|nr:arginine biosynthesis bifunctional protein ArgJ [Clostridia bacterium]
MAKGMDFYMKQIDGGVTAARGFKAGGANCGTRRNVNRLDLALIACECDCAAAAVYTTNKVKAGPVYVTMENLKNGTARAIVCNSGNANACAPRSYENARRMGAAAAAALGIREDEVAVASTGVIGVELNIGAIEAGLPGLAETISGDGSSDAVQAIMTTDTINKQYAVSVQIEGKTVNIGGIAKGSGMIHPNMATMLAFITTDCAITSEMLGEALSGCVRRTFNRISVDGDTSTNDMAVCLASGLAENPRIERKDEGYEVFSAALFEVCVYLAKAIARDGEGASRLITCEVVNSRSEEAAEGLAMSVIASSLVKTAMFGADANWGRVLCAMGYSKAPFNPELADIGFESSAGRVKVCENGAGLDFDEELAKSVLTSGEVTIRIDVKEGQASAVAWGCDLTYDYVKINGDYRS